MSHELHDSFEAPLAALGELLAERGFHYEFLTRRDLGVFDGEV